MLLQPVAGGDRAGRAGGADERGEPPVGGRSPSRAAWNTWSSARPVISKWPRWLPNSQNWLNTKFVGSSASALHGVVDLLDVALRADGLDDVLGRVLAPPVEPVEALLAHPLGQDGHAAAGHQPADGDAAAGVVAGARPDRPVTGRVELPGDHPRRQAGVRGEHLVRGDHREAVAEDDDDRAVDAGQRRRQHDVIGHVDPVAVRGRCTSAAATGCARRGRCGRRRRRARRVDAPRIGQLGERRQDDALLAEPADAVGQRVLVDDAIGQPELVLQGGGDRVAAGGRGSSGSHGGPLCQRSAPVRRTDSPRARLRNRYARRRWPS